MPPKRPTATGSEPVEQKLLSIDPATLAAFGRITRRDHCDCLGPSTKVGGQPVPAVHIEAQDESVIGWAQTRALIEQASLSHAEVFEPSAHMPWEDWMRVITLPSSVASLTDVKVIRMYGSHLRRLPPEIGRMSSLQDLDIYTSYSLHWLPYELTRCSALRESRMSTRALYGNRNTRLPFPRLSTPIPSLLPATCSVCDRGFDDRSPRLLWTTQRLGTDHMPLLIHSCSESCTASVPAAPRGYFERPHRGGGGVGMPDRAYWESLRRPAPARNSMS